MKNRRLTAEMGLRLPRQAIRMLKDRGIYAYAPVSLEYQHLAARHVVRGIESGGAAGDLGRYVTFASENGEPIDCLHPVDAIGVNGVHSIVIAPVIVRIDMLRIGRTYELLITRHKPNETAVAERPSLRTDTLYRGIHGRLEMNLDQTTVEPRVLMPTFYSFAGEEFPIPKKFAAAVLAATRAVNCVGCTHSHYVQAPSEVKSHIVGSARSSAKAKQSARMQPALSTGVGAETESANDAA